MPQNLMNVGADYSFSCYDGTSGALVDFDDIESIKITAQKHDIAARPYNDDPRFGYVADGFKIEFDIVRTDSSLEDYAVLQNQNLDNGVVQNPGFLNETIINPDGSTSRYQYTNFVWFVTDHGDVSREKIVKIKVEGMASRKVQIA
jgi:hypothetical protein